MKQIKYDKEHKEHLLELLRYIWTGLSYSKRKERFEWCYENNPYCQVPFVFLAMDDNNAAGFRAFVCQKARMNNKTTNIFCPADAIVHPDYRRMGIFSKLNKVCLLEAGKCGGIIINLSSNKYSMLGGLKQGWQKTNGIKKYGFKISIYNSIAQKLGIKAEEPNLHYDIVVNKKHKKFVISNINQPRLLASFVEANRPKDKISNLRDTAYFEWRYAYETDKYIFAYAYEENELVGYLILKSNSSKQYTLMEYSALSNKELRWMIKQAMRKLCIVLLRTWVLSEDDQITMRYCGFFIEPTKLMKLLGKERLPVIVRPTIPVPKEQDFLFEGKDIRNINNWQLFLADRH